jgi:hypothetical protein
MLRKFIFNEGNERMGNGLIASRGLAKCLAAVAIAAFWCMSTLGTAIGVTSLATAVTATTSTAAQAYYRGYRGYRRRRHRRRRWWHGHYRYW